MTVETMKPGTVLLRHRHGQTVVFTGLRPRWWYRLLRMQDPKPYLFNPGIGFSPGPPMRFSRADVEAALKSPDVVAVGPGTPREAGTP